VIILESINRSGIINPKINGIETIKREKHLEKLELKYSIDSSFDLIW